MSKYTTGEIAKLCGVSVRTVQYYDSRGILVPSELSEGGRRLYSEDDRKRMHIICFLREVGFPINSIAALFAEEKPESIISLLLEQQEQLLREELNERQTHWVNHCTQHIHENIDCMTDHENQHHYNRACYYIIRTHTYCQTVEHSRQNTSGKSESKQTNVGQNISKQTSNHVV